MALSPTTVNETISSRINGIHELDESCDLGVDRIEIVVVNVELCIRINPACDLKCHINESL